jgi:hypothetical protein
MFGGSLVAPAGVGVAAIVVASMPPGLLVLQCNKVINEMQVLCVAKNRIKSLSLRNRS